MELLQIDNATLLPLLDRFDALQGPWIPVTAAKEMAPLFRMVFCSNVASLLFVDFY